MPKQLQSNTKNSSLAVVITNKDGESYIILQKTISKRTKKLHMHWTIFGTEVSSYLTERFNNMPLLGSSNEIALQSIIEEALDDNIDIQPSAYAAIYATAEKFKFSDENWKYIFDNILKKKANLIRIKPEHYGIKDHNDQETYEVFCLHFKKLDPEEVFSHFRQSPDVILAKISDFKQEQRNRSSSIEVTKYHDIEVRNNVAIIATKIANLRQAIHQTISLPFETLIRNGIKSHSPLAELDLKFNLLRMFLPLGLDIDTKNHVCILAKSRANGKLTATTAQVFDMRKQQVDTSFTYLAADTATKLFDQLPIQKLWFADLDFKLDMSCAQSKMARLEIMTIVHDNTYGMQEIDDAITHMNMMSRSDGELAAETEWFIKVPFSVFRAALFGAQIECESPDGVKQTLYLDQNNLAVQRRMVRVFEIAITNAAKKRAAEINITQQEPLLWGSKAAFAANSGYSDLLALEAGQQKPRMDQTPEFRAE